MPNLLYRALAPRPRRCCSFARCRGKDISRWPSCVFWKVAGQATVDAYIDQGLRVRPHDGDILFEAGRQKLLAGDVNGALAHWTECYRDAGPHQLRIIYLLAGRIPAAMFLATFQPDWQTLMPIWKRYRQLGQLQDLQTW